MAKANKKAPQRGTKKSAPKKVAKKAAPKKAVKKSAPKAAPEMPAMNNETMEAPQQNNSNYMPAGSENGTNPENAS